MLSAEKKYEEYAYVLDFSPRGKSVVIKGREGPIVQAIGEERREKIVSVLGKLSFDELTPESKSYLLSVVERIVKSNESKYVAYFNELQPLTPRLHGLELIPGIGKTFMKQIVDGRERQPFKSFEEIQQRVGLREPAKLLARRVVEELSGGSRINLFIRK